MLYLDAGSGTPSAAADYPIRFTGASGTFETQTNGLGQFSIVLPHGTYQVADGYAGFGCARPPLVTPGTVTISSAAKTQQLVTTGCILF